MCGEFPNSLSHSAVSSLGAQCVGGGERQALAAYQPVGCLAVCADRDTSRDTGVQPPCWSSPCVPVQGPSSTLTARAVAGHARAQHTDAGTRVLESESSSCVPQAGRSLPSCLRELGPSFPLLGTSCVASRH